MSGVKSVLVALMAMKAEVKFDSAFILASQIANKVSAMGFHAEVVESDKAGQATAELSVCEDFIPYCNMQCNRVLMMTIIH